MRILGKFDAHLERTSENIEVLAESVCEKLQSPWSSSVLAY